MPGTVIPRFVQQALPGEALTVLLRHKCAASAMWTMSAPALAAVLGADPARVRAGVHADNGEVFIEPLAQRGIRLTGSAPATTGVSYPGRPTGRAPGNMSAWSGTCTFARELVGFSPDHSLDGIIQSVSDHYKAES